MRVFLYLMLVLYLGACAPINTQFSCNETAGDKCLDIEAVNAMTEMQPSSFPSAHVIWIADNKGHFHAVNWSRGA